ncbi:MAG: DUF3493 domain-containing protein [Synechococcus sp. SB0668_bin_15]|nr:DUF3493 domain-containing protein [Synechococcus sp. SB0668_bin_15]MXZ83307.1 DUF3493 domain-containing protein [Synechococcus sp. SB0666_bin_14]MYC48786.1 DUF3493 domain-containing protein [Synechococcus sp. SB0662_bin_14]MYG47463.1 DUF3493 domain-containing protein [Synechococcus sp. SB0675_bin_6]MYJ58921.1 DUF3493 domain-containing protein [Synechococcus sp. SB0672_bin_6]MYK91035.1 DUF3493 domain-containing protein [Synechococcus sp. SB0669_bin_8]
MAPQPPHSLDPQLKAKLQKELRTPWQSLRRALWIALEASAALGLVIMALRLVGGEAVRLNDVLIQVGAVVLFGYLLWKDRSPKPGANPGQTQDSR